MKKDNSITKVNNSYLHNIAVILGCLISQVFFMEDTVTINQRIFAFILAAIIGIFVSYLIRNTTNFFSNKENQPANEDEKITIFSPAKYESTNKEVVDIDYETIEDDTKN